MTVGLRTKDAIGNVICDLTHVYGPYLGSTTTVASTPGSISNARFAGAAWWAQTAIGSAGAAKPVAITFDAGTNTISWDSNLNTSRIVYGTRGSGGGPGGIPGLRLKFPDGSGMQITNRDKQMWMVDKGQITSFGGSEFPSNASAQMATLSVVAKDPVVAISSPHDWAMVRVANPSTDHWTYTFVHPSGGATALNWWLFDRPDQFFTTDAGLRLKDDVSGEQSFHSSMKVIRVVDFINPGPPDTSGPLGSSISVGGGTYPSGRTYAVVFAGLCYRFEQFPPEVDHGPLGPGHSWEETASYFASIQVNGLDISVGLSTIETFPEDVFGGTFTQIDQIGSPAFLVIDVSNY